MLPPVTRLPPAQAKALLHHQNNSQVYKTVLDWMRSKLTNKLLPKMGRLFLGYVWRVGRAKLDFWLSLHLYCTKILATQTFWELWPQNCARPSYKKIRKLSKIVQRLVTLHTVPAQKINIIKKMSVGKSLTFSFIMIIRRLLLFARLKYYFSPVIHQTSPGQHHV